MELPSRLIGAVVLLWAAPAAAQIGSGWNEYMPGKTLQIRGCGSHSASGGVETFGLTCTATSGDNRAEDRMQNDYTAGTRQFQGEVRVVSLGGTNVSLKQTFMRDNGAFLMIGVAMNGRLYSVGDNGELATEVIGRWVRLNTIHDVGAGTVQIYVDGTLKVTKTGARQVAWYDKYGSYRLGSGHGPITVEWRNTRFWRDGRGTGGTPPPAPDAAPAVPADAAADATVAADAAPTGPVGGPDARAMVEPGTGGSTGGSTGAGTGGGTGGSRPPPAGGVGGGVEETPDAGEETPSRARSSGGCALVRERGHSAGLVALLVLLAPWRRRVSRSSPRSGC